MHWAQGTSAARPSFACSVISRACVWGGGGGYTEGSTPHLGDAAPPRQGPVSPGHWWGQTPSAPNSPEALEGRGGGGGGDAGVCRSMGCIKDCAGECPGLCIRALRSLCWPEGQGRLSTRGERGGGGAADSRGLHGPCWGGRGHTTHPRPPNGDAVHREHWASGTALRTGAPPPAQRPIALKRVDCGTPPYTPAASARRMPRSNIVSHCRCKRRAVVYPHSPTPPPPPWRHTTALCMPPTRGGGGGGKGVQKSIRGGGIMRFF